MSTSSNASSSAAARRAAVALLALVLGLGLASCGRQDPTAPAPSPPAQNADYWDEVAALLAPGASGLDVATSFGATVLPGSNDRCVRLEPPAGMSCDTLAARLALDPRVRSAERNGRVETAESRQESYATDDGSGTLQTYLEQAAGDSIGLPAAHAVTRGAGVLVAVLDTGVDPSHPALQGRLAPGRDFVDGDLDPTDVPSGVDADGDGRLNEAYGHGTHVAGIVALAAPEATILPVRVLDANGRGDVASVAGGLRWAIEQGADVVNMSLGMLRRSDVIQDLLEEAESLGIVVVASAGNWGSETPREFPAESSHAVAVAASEADARPAGFTSFGSHVALCAPGVGVRGPYPGGGYRLWSGTSMSAPFVSGASALLLAAQPTSTPDDVRQRLEDTARPMTGLSPAQQGKLGDGMLDAGAALGPGPGARGTR